MAARRPRRGRVTGLGGVFFKSPNPDRLNRWYERHLGLTADATGGVTFRWREDSPAGRKGLTVWAVFPRTTRYFSPSKSPFMLNYRVDDLDAILTRLKKAGVWVDPKRSEASYGKFGWIRDRDGNRVELWEPPTPRPRKSRARRT